jgi:predicted nucleic acid-binding protein
MRGPGVYLDTSCVVKRYVEERGTEVVDRVYGEAEAGRLVVAFSVWNVGEAIGVLDRYHRRGVISDGELETALRLLASETMKMTRLGALHVLPISSRSLVDSWLLVLRHHLYEADALQISSAKEAGCRLFLGADGTLLEAAGMEGLKCVNIEKEPERAMEGLEPRQ